VAGILGIAAGVVTFVWPDVGIAQLVLGMWAVHSWQRSLWTLVTLVGVWAVVHGVNEILAAFAVRKVGRQAERLIG
jgi:uncharacterized membrane protein HdeD (DUF308 family)